MFGLSQSVVLSGINAETPTLWPPDAKSWLILKDPDVEKDWGQEEKGVTEDDIVGWHHWLHGHEFEQTLGDGEGQGSLVCCSPWGHKELDMTEGLNNNNSCCLRDVVEVSGRNFGAWGMSMTSCMGETVKNPLLSTVLSNAQNIHAEGKHISLDPSSILIYIQFWGIKFLCYCLLFIGVLLVYNVMFLL